jgi:phosphoglycolate phosphatase
MDSTPTIVDCIQQGCRDLGFEAPDDALASSVIGLGIQDLLRRAVPWIEPVHFPKLTERFRYHYLAKDHELHLFPGIRELLASLREDGYFLGIATGKPRVGLNRSLKHHQLEQMFHETRTADESFSKPHPGMLLELSDVMQVPIRRILMIGDTTHDLDMAANAGVDAVAVTYGAHPLSTLKESPSLTQVDDVSQLSRWLNDNLTLKNT